MDGKTISRFHRTHYRPEAPYTHAKLLELTEQGYGQQVNLDPTLPLLIGRDPQSCGLVLTDPRIAARHAQVQWEAGWCVIHDLDSLYGVLVNNRRVTACHLRHNDLIELGDTRLVFIAA